MSTQYSILDNNPNFIVVYKQPGIAVQGEGFGFSLVSQVKKDLGFKHLFPVHRLDVPTSGLVVMAKTVDVNRELSLAFKNREVSKYYLAITHKKTSKKQGVVVGDMQKARGGSYKLVRTRLNPAQTVFYSYGLGDGKRLIVLKPTTGKTHQLRVALKSLAAPIVGDERYGGAQSDRMYLHALQLGFILGGQKYVYSQLPQEGELFLSGGFLACMENIGVVDQLSWAQYDTKKE